MLHNQLMVWYPRPLTIKVELPPVRATETRQPKESILCQMAFSGLQDALSSGLSLCSLELRQLASVFSFNQREFNSLAFFFSGRQRLSYVSKPQLDISMYEQALNSGVLDPVIATHKLLKSLLPPLGDTCHAY